MKRAIHWFRRDLRLIDNTALHAAATEAAEVVPVYVLSDWTSSHRWTGANRQSFLCGCLESLAKNLESLGGRLILREGDAVAALEKLVHESRAEAIFFNRDPDPFGRATEDRVRAMAGRCGVSVHDFKDVCVHERDEVQTGSGDPFRVFTPYSKAWMKLPKPARSGRLKTLAVPSGLSSVPLPTLDRWKLPAPAPGVVAPGEKAARERMKAFLASGLAVYGERRNLPAGDATSRLSQDLRFGLLSIRNLFEACVARRDELSAAGRNSAQKYISELIWREFYMQVLWHYPDVLEHEFNPRFRGMEWPGDTASFERWCSAETGFPIVDASMRELLQTGFMHNRTRMITAMFLTKDLLLDWRLGEKFFMQHLTDGEIASNNGGWQWSAGTGADAAPYFRIQNPWTQTKRYDPDGRYIKTWLPELRDVPAEKLCEPPAPGLRLAKNYPPPMLDHSVARDRALDLFARYPAQPAD